MTDDYFIPRNKEIEISTASGTVEYIIKELLASERNLLLFQTGKLLGQSAANVLSGYVDNVDYLNKGVDLRITGHIIHGLYQNATPEELNTFITKVILKCVTSPKNASIKEGFDYHFCQYYDHQPPLLAAIYEHNFGSVITGLKKKLSTLNQTTRKSGAEEKETPAPESSQTESVPKQSVLNSANMTS